MPARNIFIDENKENIISDYKSGLSLYEVSKKYDTSYGVIRTRLDSWGIKRRASNHFNKKNITKEVLEDLRLVKKLSYKDMAKVLDVSYITLIKYVKKYNLPLTPRARKWSRDYNKCRGCGTTERKHIKDGYCLNCARKLGLVVYKWPKKYKNGCVICGTVTSAHKQYGVCSRCWHKEFYKDSKLQRKNKYEWSIDYPCCVICGTIEHQHASNGKCVKCSGRADNSVDFKVCPVCGEKYVQIFRHWRQEIIKKDDKEHTKYLKDVLEKYFNSNLGLDKIAAKVQTERHIVTRWFNYFFGKKETKKRNENVRCFHISSKAAKNFPYGPTVQHPEYIDVLGRVFKFRSKLEHIFAMWLDKNELVWEYENYTFPYDAVDGKIRHYTPDFYFPEFDFFIELKGRKFENTEHKIKQTEKQNNIKIYTLWQNEVVCNQILRDIS